MRRVFERLKTEGLSYFVELSTMQQVPLVQDREVLFLYHNEQRPIRDLRLVHHIATLDRAPKLERIHPTGPYALHLVLPPKSRVEYTFGINYLDGGSEIITDPLNPRKAWCPYGPKSVVTTGNYQNPPWSVRRPEIDRGYIEEFTIPSVVMNDDRKVLIYNPAEYPPRGGYPILLVYDGTDYMYYSDLIEVLDNLIFDGLVQPLLVALTIPHNRNEEYSCTPRHPAFIAEELLPWIKARYTVSTRREQIGMLGASFGAVASVYAAAKYPEHFGKLFLQSGSFRFQNVVRAMPLFEPLDEFDRITLFLETEFFPSGPFRKMKIYHTCGTFESILSYNRSFYNEMKKSGHRILYKESHDGHNWISWRDHLGDGLRYLFPRTEPLSSRRIRQFSKETERRYRYDTDSSMAFY